MENSNRISSEVNQTKNSYIFLISQNSKTEVYDARNESKDNLGALLVLLRNNEKSSSLTLFMICS